MMILLWVLLIGHGVKNSQGTSIEITTKQNPFRDLMIDLLKNCPHHETVFFYGNIPDAVVKAAVDNYRKIQPLTIKNEGVTVKANDLLVIFLDQMQVWSQTVTGIFLGINTVLVVVERLQLDHAKMIFADLWNASESTKVFVCSELQDGKSLEIVTFNPYNDYAPQEFWIRLDERIFSGIYSPGTTIDSCSILLFDRTKYLNNYPIQALQFIPKFLMSSTLDHYLITHDYSPSHIIDYPYMYQIISSLMQSLSVSINMTNLLNRENTTSSVLKAFSLSKSIDLKIHPTSLRSTTLLRYFDLSYPFIAIKDVIVTHQLGLMSPLEKMFNFYGWLTIVATVIIISAAFLVIYLSNNLVLSFSIFESLRLIINVAINSRMESTKSRIFFSMIFLYFLVIQATFSGHLAAFLTKPEYRKNVEDLEDLKDSRYQVIYAHPGVKSYITDEQLLKKTVFGNYYCNTDTLTNVRAACVDNYKLINYLIAEFNLHQAKKPLVTKFSSFLLRKNWRLNDRVNQVLARIVDSGLNFKKFNFSGSKINLYYKRLQDHLGPNYYRPVELQDLLFIFVLLGTGLLFASLAFIGEILVQGWKEHQKAVRKRWRSVKRSVCVARRMVVVKVGRWVTRPGKKSLSRA